MDARPGDSVLRRPWRQCAELRRTRGGAVLRDARPGLQLQDRPHCVCESARARQTGAGQPLQHQGLPFGRPRLRTRTAGCARRRHRPLHRGSQSGVSRARSHRKDVICGAQASSTTVPASVKGGFAMRWTALRGLAAFGAVLLCGPAALAAKYPAMAPLDQYMMDPSAEIALAKSAAPPSISDNATVLVLTRKGYQTAVKGSNGFVC